MSMTEIPHTASRREMRKALIRLRMEMHRQEIRHESQQLMAPLNKVRDLRHNWQDSLGIKHAPLWGVAAVTLMVFFTGKGAKGGSISSLTRLVRLGAGLVGGSGAANSTAGINCRFSRSNSRSNISNTSLRTGSWAVAKNTPVS